jgi:hypothetical protein
MDIHLKRMNWPHSSPFSATIIAAARKRVCALIDSFAVCLHRNYPGLGVPPGEVVRSLIFVNGRSGS